MRFRRALLLLLCSILLPASALAAAQGQVRIGFLSGDVQVRDPESGEWAVVSVNTPLDEGDELWVPDDGRAEIVIDGSSFVRLDHDTALGVLAIDNDSTQFYLTQGRAYVHFEPDGKKVLQFDTPEISTRAFQRSSYDLYTADALTDASAYKGSVQVDNEAGSTRLNAGNMLSLGKETEVETAPVGRADEWERWNKARDERLASRGDSTRYLPSELHPYSHDLDDSGRWVQVPDYGYVWTPTLTVGVEWAPYRHGRWIWRGGDYVWVAYEPWGWVPFHYGRWFFAARIGWCWVPPVRGAVYWSPGYVGWVRTPDYVAWVPLAPREIYYGYGDYGPHSVNVRNVTNVQVTNVYVNVRVTNAVTVVKSDSFTSGWDRPLKVKQEAVTKDIFTPKHFLGGRPSIKPVKTSFMPVIKEIPPSKRPPPRVGGFFSSEVRKSRPLVKKPEESSWSRGVKPKELKVRTLQAPKPVRAKPHAAPPPDKALTVPPVRKPPEGQPESKPQEGFRGGFPQGGRPEGKIEDKRLEGRRPEVSAPQAVEKEKMPPRPPRLEEIRPPQRPEQGTSGKEIGPRPGEIRPPEKGAPAAVPPGQRKRIEEAGPAAPPGRGKPEGTVGKGAEPKREAAPVTQPRQPGQPGKPGRPAETGRPAPQGPAVPSGIRPDATGAGIPQQLPQLQGQGQGKGQGQGQGQSRGKGILPGPDGKPVLLGPDGKPVLGPDGKPILLGPDGQPLPPGEGRPFRNP